MRLGDREVELEVRAERDLDDPVDLPDPLGGARLAVVDDEVRGAGELRLLVARHRGHDLGPAPACELDRGVADRSRAARDEHPPAVERPVGEQAVVGGQRRDAERGAEVEARVAGSGTACATGTTVYCAAVPHWRFQAAK